MAQSTKRKLLLVVAVTVIVGVIYGGWSLLKTQSYQKKVAEIQLNPRAFSDIQLNENLFGTYTGEFDVDYVAAKAQVVIEKGQIKEVRLLEHKNDRGSEAERVVDEMNERKTTDVENITGATNSSKVIKKAVENAIDSAIRQ